MAYYTSSLPFDALLLEAAQPYYRHQIPQQSQKSRRCAPAAPAGPRLDASESETDFKLYIALPGLERKDLMINVEQGVLLLEANRPADPALDHFRSIPAKLHCTWKLPDSVDASGIRARLANGELIITLPKAAKMEPRQVLISGDEGMPAAPPSAEAASALPPTAHDDAHPATDPDSSPAAASQPASAPAEGTEHEAVGGETADAKSEEDGSVEDLSDEEREAERASQRQKALPAEAGPVLMDAEEAPAVAA